MWRPNGLHQRDLPDELLLLLVLSGLGCTAAAARTSILSRRWRGLWARLGDISLRDVPFPSLAAVLSQSALSPALRLPLSPSSRSGCPGRTGACPGSTGQSRADVASLMRAAARLALERLVLALPQGGSNLNPADLHLPCFRLAASIMLESLPFVLRPPAATGGEVAALHTLHLLDCIVMDEDLDALLFRRRLRVLVLRHKLTTWPGDHGWRTVHSAMLEELAMDSERAWARRVDVVAPALKQLVVSFGAYEEVSISVAAPMVEKFWWHCCYAVETIGFGLWSLHMLTLQTPQRQGELPSLQIYAGNCRDVFSDEEANLEQEI